MNYSLKKGFKIHACRKNFVFVQHFQTNNKHFPEKFQLVKLMAYRHVDLYLDEH